MEHLVEAPSAVAGRRNAGGSWFRYLKVYGVPAKAGPCMSAHMSWVLHAGCALYQRALPQALRCNYRVMLRSCTSTAVKSLCCLITVRTMDMLHGRSQRRAKKSLHQDKLHTHAVFCVTFTCQLDVPGYLDRGLDECHVLRIICLRCVACVPTWPFADELQINQACKVWQDGW